MDAALSTALFSGPLPGRELRQRLGVSQPTLSRMLRTARAELAVLGRGRATRYGLYRRVRDLPPELPLHRVDAAGDIQRIGTLITLAPDRYWHEDLEQPRACREYLSLPWFITDMRPQGYLGRLFPLRYEDLALPDRVSDWSEDHALYALARRGEDMAGNLVIAEESLARWLQLAAGRLPGRSPIAHAERLEGYSRLAGETLAGKLTGSSAAGEQPKFTAEATGAAGQRRHVLVKFSAPLETPTGRRWSDLLLAEHLAGEVLREHGHTAAVSGYLADDRRAYLEVERFDRTGPAGRLGIVSLGTLDDEFVGERAGWAQSAAALLRARIISPEDAREVRWLSAFGTLIANTDMHLGNISFYHSGGLRLGLAPVYDMLPMFYAPVREEVPVREFEVPAPIPAAADQWRSALPVACAYWRRVGADERVSADFRALARRNAALLAM